MNRSARIAVLGEALVDVFEHGRVIGGAPFNVARNLAALGAAPVFVSRVGVDADGDAIATQMSTLGMRMHGLQRDRERRTGHVQVREHDGHPSFQIEADGAWDWLDAESATSAVRAARPALAYFGTLAQRAPQSRAAIRAALAAMPAQRFLDLNLRGMPDEREISAESLEYADLLKVNEDELRALLAWTDCAGTEADATHELMRKFALRRVVVTRAAQGWSCYDAGERGWQVLSGSAPKVRVVDTVGAGDAFSSVLLLGEMRGWELAVALERAAGFSAVVCTLRGAFDPDSAVYAETLARWA